MGESSGLGQRSCCSFPLLRNRTGLYGNVFLNCINDQPASMWVCEMLKNPLILHKWAVRSLHTQFKALGRWVRNRICGVLGW